VLLLDSLAVLSGGLLYGWKSGIDSTYLGLTLFLLVVITLITFHHWKLYRFETLSTFPKGLGKILIAIVSNLFLFIGALTALGVIFTLSQYWLGISVTVSFIMIFLMRRIISGIIASWFRSGRLVQNVAVVGAGRQGQRVISDVKKKQSNNQHFIGIFDDRKTRIDHSQHLVGDIDTLVADVRKGLIQHIIIALPWSAEQRILDLITKLRELPVDISLSSDLVAYNFSGIYQQTQLNDITLLVDRIPASSLWGSVKWMEDKLLATLLIVCLAPVLILIIAAIKLDSPGPILFRQKRYGFNRQPITIYKFRTMHDSNSSGRFIQATRDDSRITRVGSILRKASLDELPQLFNVFQGDMSLVGPRPHPIDLDEQFSDIIPRYNARFRVKPGITGWAQINGWRGETETKEKMCARLEHDLYYIENWSIWFDFRILIQTAYKGWVHQNAF
jgi:Undecaprenyl-phosphate glucose phosphotransferase